LDEAYKPGLVKKPEELESVIPVSVFSNDYLSALEAIVKYLHENRNMRLSEIAKLICRDQRAVGVTYRFARKKMKLVLKAPVSKYKLPVSIVAERKLSVLESIVYHLKITYHLSYHDIANIIKRDDRTVWTVYQRALKKLKRA
jgi:DNA-directed RNA polymerase specialized sigma24 family protein